MEEQFILRVPPSLAEKIDRLLNEDASAEDKTLDLSFSEDGRSGTFVIGNDHFPASLLDLPCVVESFKTYDDCALVKTADIGQMIMVREPEDPAPSAVEYRHGLTPPMKDARKRRFRREPDLNSDSHVEVNEQEEEGDENARNANKKALPASTEKPEAPATGANAGEPEPDRTDSDESDDSM